MTDEPLIRGDLVVHGAREADVGVGPAPGRVL